MINWLSRHKKKSAGMVLALALPLVAQYEGLRTKSYLDPVGVLTVCYGETESVVSGVSYTEKECKEMLSARLGYFSLQVDRLVKIDISPETHAALSSFAYNVGLSAFEKSTLLKKMNAGDIIGACNELPRWNKANGKILPGLVKRRQAEKKLCLSNI